jgi:hypothetical protein
VDSEFVAVARDEHHDLEQVARSVWTDDEPPIGILTEIVDDEWVRDGMGDVVIVRAVASSRSMDLHTLKSYYEIDNRRAGSSKCHASAVTLRCISLSACPHPPFCRPRRHSILADLGLRGRGSGGRGSGTPRFPRPSPAHLRWSRPCSTAWGNPTPLRTWCKTQVRGHFRTTWSWGGESNPSAS